MISHSSFAACSSRMVFMSMISPRAIMAMRVVQRQSPALRCLRLRLHGRRLWRAAARGIVIGQEAGHAFLHRAGAGKAVGAPAGRCQIVTPASSIASRGRRFPASSPSSLPAMASISSCLITPFEHRPAELADQQDPARGAVVGQHRRGIAHVIAFARPGPARRRRCGESRNSARRRV